MNLLTFKLCNAQCFSSEWQNSRQVSNSSMGRYISNVDLSLFLVSIKYLLQRIVSLLSFLPFLSYFCVLSLKILPLHFDEPEMRHAI